ncbi:MAG: TadE/TadG family type IV pilus assembly protein [Pseudomonadota bacterium]
MKRPIEAKARDFKRDINGATAVIYALCLLPLTMFVGVAVDGARMVSAKKHMQASMDAAVLNGAREFVNNAATDDADRKALTKAAIENMYHQDVATAHTDLGKAKVTSTITDLGEVSAVAVSDLPMVFGAFFGRSFQQLSVTGAAQAGDSRKIEVILALDNTSSMFEQDRFTKMREASKGFVNTMFDQTPAAGLMSIGVVPWASVVNINSEAPGAWNPAPAMAGTPPVYGSARTPNAAFESRRKYLYEPEAEKAYTAAAMARDFAPVEWRGCVRSAPNERVVSTGGFVTKRLTDDAVSGMRWHASWLEPELQTYSIPSPPSPPKPPKPPKTPKPPSPPSPPSPPPPPKPPVPGPQGSIIDLAPPIQNASLDIPGNRLLKCTQSSNQAGYDGLRNVYMNETQLCATAYKKPLSVMSPACVSDPTEFGYFAGGGKACAWQQDIFPWSSYKPVSGPNMNCPTAMLGLSGDRGQILEKLDHMYPVQGGTQADIGLMWGLRALSPRSTWASFFGTTGDQEPKPFQDAGVRKIMILLTDGKNEAPYHFEGYYGCNESGDRGAAGKCWKAKGVKSLDGDSLDGLTLDSCKAIREDYDIELYTIAVDISDSAAIKLLGDCAADADRTFNITSSQLDKTFSAIAARELRLTK